MAAAGEAEDGTANAERASVLRSIGRGCAHVARLTVVLGLPALHLIPPSRERYAQHRAEFADLLRRLDKESLPTLLLGDFNFVDHGPLAAALHARGFYDAHGIAGTGRGATWPVHGWFRHVPGIRIDHVYAGPGLTATSAWVGTHTGSDHLPVGAEVVLAEPGVLR